MIDNLGMALATICSELNCLTVFTTILSSTRLVEIALSSIAGERLINGIIKESKSVVSK